MKEKGEGLLTRTGSSTTVPKFTSFQFLLLEFNIYFYGVEWDLLVGGGGSTTRPTTTFCTAAMISFFEPRKRLLKIVTRVTGNVRTGIWLPCGFVWNRGCCVHVTRGSVPRFYMQHAGHTAGVQSPENSKM